ncbi:glycine--tRNA ligase subunit beta [Caldimonas thermodepolymerans]|jgi:glycyl-tRNA synthetase, tetrameric type, beta subunit|uniref:Glycine--tRNA ligase beta subunit n=1 Tax=Caldimonas thermodepolymerans TaxID=215580 RepID=A0AA46DFD0_9BURK|nr:glycine--tRNA ligase subunit beta [Caldimonas thermodepolymerans]TCP08245.1 glycyl-tRNA synthetase beta chain [Caldimonas thermodepolymerans]UZG44898.1 glycine--tRNA ligase subunit beta [Caldimonas thermodepolymerans]UZG48641.1 glycine--tRNA ligase subunit beta [Caldimonas thermodepolymerans]
MSNKNLLVELFVEELPPKALKKLGDAFASVLADRLKAQGLADAAAVPVAYASPRRLAAWVPGVAARAADKPVQQKLMPVSVGLDAQGQPTPALLKKLAALGVDASVVPQLRRAVDGKAEALFHDSVAPGVTLAEGLQKALEDAIAGLPIPKVMTYQLADGWTSVNFVRPAHGLVALHGDEVVPVSVLGLQAGRNTQGHRFEALHNPIVLRDADSYAEQMRSEGAVIASFDERRAEIARQLQAAAERVGGGVRPIEDEALLDEVTALVERPNVLVGQFEPEFLEVPQECLILTMKANQKYFPLLDADGRLTHRFLVVSNISPDDPSAVIGGNERVVRPRLADAKFFFDQDRKKTLASRVPGLAKVVYHNKLGSQGERIERVRTIARAIAETLGGPVLAQRADQVAMLAKADLLTDMVGEFPELQGIMGRYYALNDGLDTTVADAIEDHYKPRFAGDELPRHELGVVVALADKLETLAGLFGIGQVPTGDKDPFALRRHALGVIRMLIERDLPLEPQALIDVAFAAFPAGHGQAQAEVAQFMRERLVNYLRDAGYGAREVEAVVEVGPARWGDIPKRLQAVRAFASLPEAESLAAANKRVGNILKKAEGAVEPRIDAALLREPAEQALAQALQEVKPQADAAFERGDYAVSLQALAALKAPVDAFFDTVMVNAEDPALRANRLGLLATLHAAMNRVADLSRLAG